MSSPEVHPLIELYADPSACTMCGASSGDAWETEPERSVIVALGNRFWDIPEAEVSTLDRTPLCDECLEGIAGLRRSGVERE